MGKLAIELGALDVSRMADPGLHAVGGVPGLMLQITPTGARSWVLRLRVGGKRREAGLGGYPGVPLADARRRARELREQADKGIDPIAERMNAKAKLRADMALERTFAQCAEAFIQAKGAGWKNRKHCQQWTNTLATYAYPVMAGLNVRDVTKAHVLAVLDPVWTAKPETGARLRSRIELVLSYAMQKGYRPEGLNPARWKGNLDVVLSATSKLRAVEHHPALPLGMMGGFMAALRKAEGMGAKALEFAILTAARSGEVRGAIWAEIDLDEAVWTVPAGRMKAGREHRVPLSEDAIKLLRALLDARPGQEPRDLIFPAPRKGGALSDMTLTASIRRLNKADANKWVDAGGRAVTVHGFRSTFRDWAGERTHHRREVIENALAHRVGDAAEQSYARGSLFDKRRILMEDWAGFVSRVKPSNVLPIHAKAG